MTRMLQSLPINAGLINDRGEEDVSSATGASGKLSVSFLNDQSLETAATLDCHMQIT